MMQDERLLVVSAHAAEYEWRAGGTIAKNVKNGAKEHLVVLSVGVRGESNDLWKTPDQTAEHVKEILEARDRKEAGETAPARGLTMVGIQYEKEPALTVTGENEHWSYILDQTELETSKTAVLKILFCEPEEVIRLVRRMVHQAYWNGAETVFIEAPEACGLNGAETYGFYRLVQAENGRWRAVEKRLV